MATWYVNKSGSDSNDGLSAATAKLTIMAAHSVAAANGDYIVVGSGLYNETLLLTKYITFMAEGNVILDGTSTSACLVDGESSDRKVNFIPSTNGGTWTFQNGFTSTLIKIGQGGGSTFTKCTFISNGNTYGFYSGSASSGYTTFTNCVFVGFPRAITIGGGSGEPRVSNCTFYNCIQCISSSRSILVDSIVSNCATVWNSPLQSTRNVYYSINSTSTTSTTSNSIGTGSKTFTVGTGLTLGYYVKIKSNSSPTNYMMGSVTSYNSVTGSLVVTASNPSGSGTFTDWVIENSPWVTTSTYTNLSELQSAGYDLESVSQDPQFVDPTNNVFYLKSASSVNNLVGAYPYGLASGTSDSTWVDTGTSANLGGWYNPENNIDENVNGFFELISGTSGTLWSPVYDLGSIKNINNVQLATEQVWPTDMIDKTTSDSAPNYQTIEIRTSNITFNQDDAIITWTEVKANLPFTTNIPGRYVQIKLTFRNNDVGA